MISRSIAFCLLFTTLLFSIKATAQTEEDIKNLIAKYNELYSAHKYIEALPIAQQLVSFCEKTLGPEHLNTAISLDSLARVYESMGIYAEALPLYNRALPIFKKNLGQEHPATATLLCNLARLYERMGNYTNAETLYKQALETEEKIHGLEHPSTATCLNNLAGFYETMGNYVQAESLYKQALQIREKALGLEQPETAISLNDLAILYTHIGNYAKAEPLCNRALQINERAYGSDHPATATCLNSLAFLYGIMGNYAAAEPIFKRALQIREKVLGSDHPDTATSRNNLGVLYCSISDYTKAEQLYKRALQIDEKTLGPDHPNTATCLVNLAVLYNNIGDYYKAEQLYKRALEIRTKALGADHIDTANCLNNLGLMYDNIENYAKSEPLYKRALQIAEKNFGPDHPNTATCLDNLAFLWLKINRADKAYEAFNKLNSTAGMGKCFLKQGNFKRARELFSEKYESSDGTEAHIGLSIGLGLACEGEKSYIEAKKWFGKAISLIEQQRTDLSSLQREHFLEGSTELGFKRTDAYEGMIRVLLQENGPNAKREALRYAEMIKSRVFFEMMASRGLRSAKPEDENILERDRGFQRRLIILQKRMDIINKPGVKMPQGEAEQVKAELEKTLTEYEAFLKEVRFQNAEVAAIICALPADPASMQSTLDDDVTVLEYYTAQDRTYAWLITKNSVRLYEIKKNGADLKAKTLQADVAGLVGGNITGRTRRPAPVITLPGDQAATAENVKQAREAFNKKAQELYSLMVAPLEADIKTKKLVIVPHDVLHKLPFACLTDGSKALVDKYDLSIAPASSLIEFIVKKRKTDTGKFLAFANPATDKISLPFAEKEVQSVENMFASKQVFSRADATKGRLTSLSGEFDVVHFACHGEFNDMQPLQSGLLLAQDGDDDGLLRIPDVFGLNLQKANLVTLSACETALAKVRGGEDWAGMSRGFIYAGTPSILATLWSVDDKSTSILMKSFYENWLKKGMSKPAALRQAQLSLKAMPEYSHPFYWAPFVMIGDWR